VFLWKGTGEFITTNSETDIDGWWKSSGLTASFAEWITRLPARLRAKEVVWRDTDAAVYLRNTLSVLNRAGGSPDGSLMRPENRCDASLWFDSERMRQNSGNEWTTAIPPRFQPPMIAEAGWLIFWLLVSSTQGLCGIRTTLKQISACWSRGEASGVIVTIKKGAPLSGIVLGPSGAPVRNAEVIVAHWIALQPERLFV